MEPLDSTLRSSSNHSVTDRGDSEHTTKLLKDGSRHSISMEAEEGEGETTTAASSDLRRELTRLQEREALLTHLLCLEREKRVKAEQLVEVEHLACLELGQRLGRERKAVATVRKRAATRLTFEQSCSKDDGISLHEEGGVLMRTGVNLKVRCDLMLVVSLSLSLSIHLAN